MRMNNLQVFNFQERDIRTVVRNGEPWFVAKDVCDILEISNVTDAMIRLSEKMKAISVVPTQF
jgi:anti-repressor protein